METLGQRLGSRGQSSLPTTNQTSPGPAQDSPLPRPRTSFLVHSLICSTWASSNLGTPLLRSGGIRGMCQPRGSLWSYCYEPGLGRGLF